MSEVKDDLKREKVRIVEISKIQDFPDHPFLVKEDESMDQLVNSIRMNGVLNPVIARRVADEHYELISGHRRKRASMVLGALGVFIPQMTVAMFTKNGGIGGADIKLSTAAALSLGYGGVIGYTVGLIFAIVFQLAYNHIKKQSNQKAFPLLPFLSTGLMIGYFI